MKIHETRYSCEMNEERPLECSTLPSKSLPKQLKQVSSLCDRKEHCSVQASRKWFDYVKGKCSEVPDSDMTLMIRYSCNEGGKDETRLTGSKDCKLLKGELLLGGLLPS